MQQQKYIPVYTKYCTGGYEFAFNGQEKGQEIYNIQSTTTATFWEYDGRIGRRWNIDPVMKEWESPYLCFSGNPIFLTDRKGDNADNWNVNTKTGEVTHNGTEGGDQVQNVKYDDNPEVQVLYGSGISVYNESTNTKEKSYTAKSGDQYLADNAKAIKNMQVSSPNSININNFGKNSLALVKQKSNSITNNNEPLDDAIGTVGDIASVADQFKSTPLTRGIGYLTTGYSISGHIAKGHALGLTWDGYNLVFPSVSAGLVVWREIYNLEYTQMGIGQNLYQEMNMNKMQYLITGKEVYLNRAIANEKAMIQCAKNIRRH